MFSKPEVRVGDRFTKVGTYQTRPWVVARLFQHPAEPPHAQLEREGDNNCITVSVSALTDPSLFKRVNG